MFFPASYPLRHIPKEPVHSGLTPAKFKSEAGVGHRINISKNSIIPNHTFENDCFKSYQSSGAPAHKKRVGGRRGRGELDLDLP